MPRTELPSRDGANGRTPLNFAAVALIASALTLAAFPAAAAPSSPRANDAAVALAGSVSGTVTLSDGRPLDGGSVGVLDKSGQYLQHATVAADGSYRFNALAPGTYSLHFERGQREAEYADYVPVYWGGGYEKPSYFDLGSGQRRTGMNAVLGLGATVSGRVSLDASAVLGSSMTQLLSADGISAPNTVTSESDGSFTIRGVPPGRWTIEFRGSSADGEPYVPEYWGDRPYRSQARYLDLTAGAVLTKLNAQLSRGGSVSGRLSGPDGAPVANAEVHLQSAETPSTGVHEQEATTGATTDETGRYTVRGIAPGNWRLFFYAPAGSGLRDEWWSDRPWGQYDAIRILPRASLTRKDATLTYESKSHPWGEVSRLQGVDRYATAVAVSASQFAPGAPVAYLASGTSFPDALAAAPVAAATGGPILLSPSDRLPPAVADELRRLQPKRIVILGGGGAIEPAVERALARLTTGSVTRIGGADRYETAAALSRTRFAPGVPVAYLTSGSKFPDALSAAPQAALGDAPILLAPGNDSLPAAVVAELKRLKPEVVHIIGGGVVGPRAHAQLDALVAGDTIVHSGPDRYATSAMLSDWFDYGVSVAYVANGTDFPDALAGGPVAGIGSGPVLLTERDRLPPKVAEALRHLRPDRIVILGGPGAVSAKVAAQLRSLSG